ncbi:MAG TPA: FG-GAP-like repeat-containing protein, partial [Acidobacteriaceae bacterium]
MSTPFARSRASALSLFFLLALLAVCPGTAAAYSPAAPTTTSLTLESSAGTVTSVSAGTVVTLIATVTSGSTPVPHGQVNFCDANATFCTDSHLLGTAQLTSSGTAVIKLRPGIGTYSYKAVFAGTSSYTGSASSASPLTATGSYPTTIDLAKAGSAGNYILSATVTSAVNSASIAAPTGSLSFLDTTNSNALLATGSLSPGTLAASFAPQVTYATGSGSAPQAVAVGDFNGDGIPDFAVANSAASTVGVFLGNGDGTFNPQVTYSVGTAPQAIVVGDFNGDGILDLAVANTNNVPANVSILLGRGDGTFNPQVTYATDPTAGSAPISLTMGDFNGDGILDLAVANKNTANISILLGDGLGAFTLQASSPSTGNSPTSIVTGDFNGDGILDLATANFSGDNVSILLGNGDGTFQTAVNDTVGTSPTSVAIGDFNGDGVLDLAVVNSVSNSVSILLGDGHGVFTLQSSSPSTGTGPLAVAVGDFNGDGVSDLAVTNVGDGSSNGSISVLLGNGDGTFTPESSNPVTNNAPALFAVADLNGDGVPDLAVPNSSSDNIGVLLGTLTETATASVTGLAPVGSGSHDVVAQYAGDSLYNASTSPSVTLTATRAGTTLTLGASPASSSEGQTVQLTVILFPSSSGSLSTDGETVTFYDGSTVLNTAALSGGVASIFVPGFSAGTHTLSVSYGGDANFAASTSSTTNFVVVPATTTALAVTAAGNPVTDVPPGTLVTLTASVVSGSTPVTGGQVNFCDATSFTCTDIHLLGTAQLTSSGTAVLNLKPFSGFKVYSAIYAGTANFGTSSSSVVALNVDGFAPTVTTIAQSGSAGNYTLTATVVGMGVGAFYPGGPVFFEDTTNANATVGSAILGTGTLLQTFSPQTPYTAGTTPGAGAIGDFNGDGVPDIVTVNGGENKISVLLGTGNGAFAAAVKYSTGNTPTGVVVGDFNNDGLLDIAVSNTADSTVSVFLGKGDGTFNAPVTSSSGAANFLAVADFNRDGTLDLAATTGAGNGVNILLGNGNGTFQAPVSYSTGSNAQSVVAGDLNGDGAPDFAVTNFADNTVAVLLNNGDGTFGAAAPHAVGNGPQGLALADVNHDGVLDLIAANQTDNTVSVLIGFGNGDFNSATPWAAGNHPTNIAVADINGDTIPDLAVTDTTDNTVSVLTGVGDGTFNAPTPAATDNGPITPLAGDFNADGVTDLATVNTTGDVSVLLGQITQTVTGSASGLSVVGSGTHQVKASYPGDSTYAASDSATTPLTAAPAATTLSLSASPVTGIAGRPVTLTATLSPFGAGGLSTDGETITFLNGSTPIGTGTLSSGVAALRTTALPEGTNTLTASYPGDGNFLSSTSPEIGYAVGPAPAATATALAITNPSGTVVTSVASGTVVTLTATVTVSGTPVTQGQVNFCDASATRCTDNHLLGSGQLTSSGTAVLKLKPGIGAKSYSAMFVGTTSNAASSSTASSLTVTGSPSATTTLVATGSAGDYTLTATVAGSIPTAAPTGSVSFVDTSNSNYNFGSLTLGSGALTQTFTPAASTPTSSFPTVPVTGDFNGDGVPDVAIASGGTTALDVLISNGDGTFNAKVSYPTGGVNYIAGLVVGDFNHDGKLDIAAAGVGVGIYFGNGDGTFNTIPTTYSLTHAAVSMTTGDFNGDGILDIAVATGDGSTVDVLLGNGDGTFAPRISASAGGTGGAIVATDLNGDGILDLVVTNYNENTVTPLLGAGDGSFVTGSSIPVASLPFAMTAADFNGDGIPDVAVANNGSPIVSVLLGKGDGTFQTPVPYGTPGTPQAIGAVDINGDGVVDLAVSDSGGSETVDVLLGNGDGTFQGAVGYHKPGSSPSGAAFADFNGDGITDVAITDFSASAYVLLNQVAASASTTLFNVSPVGSGPHQVKASYGGDSNYGAIDSSLVALDAQEVSPTLTLTAIPGAIVLGHPVALSATLSPFTAQNHATDGEIVTFLSGSTPVATAVLSSGVASVSSTSLPLGVNSLTASFNDDGNFTAATSSPQTVNVVATAGATTTTLALTDSTSTPVSSIAGGSPVTLTASVMSGGTPITSGQVNFCDASAATCTDAHLLGTAQLTPAGTAILKLKPGPGTRSFQAVFLGTNILLGSTSSTASLTVTGLEPTVTALSRSGSVGNYTLTARVAGANLGTASPTGTISFQDTSNSNYVLGTASLGSGTLSEILALGTAVPVGTGPEVVATGDFNRDGILDAAVVNAGSNTVGILLGNGDATFQAQVTYPTGNGPISVAVGDFNGDGFLDLAVVNSSDYTVGILLGNGDGTFQTQTTFAADLGPGAVTVADLNGDGILDLAVANQLSSDVSVLLGKGDGTFYDQVPYSVGGLPHNVTVADFNGDHIPDLAVANSANNTISVLLGRGDGTFQAQVIYPTGHVPVLQVAADFNGDGIPDLAVTNFGDNTVGVLLGLGDGTFTAQVPYPVGANPQFIAVGDINGDGLPDLAVTNFGDNTISVLRGRGDGTFRGPDGYPVGTQPAGITFADFDGDGIQDLMVANFGDNNLYPLPSKVFETATAQVNSISLAGTGSHDVAAVYPGDSLFATSTSSTVSLQAQALPTTLALGAAPSSSTYGQQITLTATLAPFSAQSHSTDGETVTFLDGASSIGTGTLSSGVATFSTTALPAGTRSLTAQYAGDTNFGASTNSTAVSLSVAMAANTVTANALTINYGSASAALSASIAYGGIAIPSGAVTFTVDSGSTLTGTCTGTSSPLNCTVSYPANILNGGSHTITVSQAADTNYSVASGTATLTVSAIAPTIAVSGVSIVYGTASASLSATLTYGGSAVPAGAFTFTVGSGSPVTATCSGSSLPTIRTTPEIPPPSSGSKTCTASYPTSTLAVNTYTITGSQAADTNYTAASNTGTLTVTQATPVVTASPASVAYGTVSTTLSASIAYTGSAAPTGAVTFQVDSATAVAATCTGSTSPLSCSASYPVNTFTGGAHTITAAVATDTNYIAASGTNTLTITTAAPTVTVSPASAVYGSASTTLTASIAYTGSAAPTGAVTLKVDTGSAV